MIRALDNDSDLELIGDWWFKQTDGKLAFACTSDYGYLYELENKPIACLFLFPVMGCKMALVGWPIANPESTKTERDVAFPLLIKFIEDEAKERGYDWLTTYASRESVAKRFENAGFGVGDSSLTQYLKYLGV